MRGKLAFVTRKTHGQNRNTISLFRNIAPYFRFASVASLNLCVLLLAAQLIFAADYEYDVPPEYEYQVLNIFPGDVTGEGWSGLDKVFSQDAQDDALFSFFSEGNSAHLVPFTEINVQESGTGSDSTPYENSVPNDGSVEPAIEEQISEPGVSDESEIIEEEIDESQTTHEPPAETESPETSPVVFKLMRGIYEFATGILTEETDNTTDSNVVEPEQLQPEVVPEAIPQEETQVVDGGVTESVDASQTNPDEPVESETFVEEVVSSSNTANACEGSRCKKHVLEFSDFSAGEGLDAQQITNMQLRMSIGARPHSRPLDQNDRIHVEYEHYDYWIDGGVIPITEEVSNAINGGYYLFAFPLYSEWDEMKRIKVRLTYESDNEHLADIFVDSVWLQVESIDNNAFNEPVPNAGDALDLKRVKKVDVPDGYVFNELSTDKEFSYDETPSLKFKLEREKVRPGLLSRIGSGIKSLFGFDDKETGKKDSLEARVVTEEFKDVVRISEKDGEFTLDLVKSRQFKPGKHTVTIEVIDGSTSFFIEQEFTWGVLALNVDKSIYLEGEEAFLQMGVLDDLGHTICDAELSLEITDPQGGVHALSTGDGSIEYGEECAGDTFTSSPDYSAYFKTEGGVGEYGMTLTATTENGAHTITDSFEVRKQVPFDITRTGPTRIYPPEPYPVTLTITAHEAYTGTIIEYVPAGFQVYESENSDAEFSTYEVGGAKQLRWDVSVDEGETITLAYLFDAPDISPEFYLLGPLTIDSFSEIREWQIASDAPDNAIIVQSVMGTPTSATTYSATLSSTPTAGNMIIMVATILDNPITFNAPASFLTQAVLSNAALEIDTGIWYAVADPATTTYSISKSGGNQTGVVYLMEVSGLDMTNPLSITVSNDQTGSNSLTASTSLSATSTQYGFAVAGITFADNDFAVPTSASWSSASANAYTQQSTVNWATGNDGTFSIATANINAAARQGATQVLTVGGTEQRNSVLAVFKLKPQSATVSTRGNQVDELKINTSNNSVGGAFTILPTTGYATVTSITISEAGTTDAQNDLSSIRLYYELDSTTPYDCASSTYDGTETQYGATSTSFTSANGTATFSGTVRAATTSAMCVYTVLNVDSSATDGHTIELQISTPDTQVVMSEGSTTPGTAVAISNTTELVIGYAPGTPVLADTPAFPHMRSTSTQPVFGGFAATDADGDGLEYEFSIDDDPLFGSPATTTYSTNYPGDAGWASSTFQSGATTTYQIQEALTPGTTYWWRVRARDPLNRNEWSNYSPLRSITISNAITVAEWHQTTEYQFGTSTTLSNATTSGNSVVIENGTTSVSLLDAWSTGNTKTVSAGSDRLLVVAIVSEDNATAVNVNTVTYGGQTLTEITDQQIGTGFSNGMWVGYLNEAGIALSSGTTITPTWTGGTPGSGIQYMSAVFEDVSQSSPVRGYSANALTSGTTIFPSASTTVYAGDMMFYTSETEDSLTHTPEGGYTEGTEQDTGGNGFVNASAYKAITADGTELPEATWSGSGNRLLMVAVALAPTPAQGVVTSAAIDFDWVSGQTDWGEVAWELTEPTGYNSKLQLLYASSSSSTCTILIPNTALSGNSTGFTSTSSPLDISSLATSTYNRICARVTLDEGAGTTSPSLNDWTIRWERSSVMTQASYWWYAYSTSTTPTDTWPPGTGGTELVENGPITSTDPVDYGDVVRLRMGLGASVVSALSKTFKLQYAEGETCSSELSWQDVGAIGSTTALWRGYNITGLTDGATLASDLLSSSSVLESYEEENNSATMPNTIAAGSQGEWEWVIEHNANSESSYCFRMVSADGSEINNYTEYPLLTTNVSPSVIALESPFDNERIASTSPWFDFLGSDPEGDTVDYQIQIDNNADFSSTVIDTDSSSNLTDFTNIDTPADKSPFNESANIRYEIPSTLSSGTTYWWRVRVTDPDGSATYGDWSTAQSFTVTTGIDVSTWYQTTEAQFDTDTLVGTDATASNNVTFASGSTTGTTTSSSIDFDDGDIGNAWGEFSFTETGGAGAILYHIEYYDGSSWTLIPDSVLAGNATGYDTSPVSLIDLDTGVYNEIRIRANFISGSPTIEDWSITWGYRVSVVTHMLLFDNEKTGTTTPTFTFTTTDPDDDDLEYEFSWSTDVTFVTGSTTVNSSTSPGFANLTTGINQNPFYSGDTIRYRMQSALTDGVTYWWRARARDPNGGNSFSFWSDPWSFTVDTLATTSTWFQTTEEQFETDTLLSVYASTSDQVTVTPAGVTSYNFSGITNPSVTHIARDFEVDVNDPTDPPTDIEIDTITTSGLVSGTPNLRSAIAGYASDAEAATAQYTAIASSDDSRWQITDPGAGDNAVFWTSFLVTEDATDIDQIDIVVEGYQAAATDKAWLGVWRPGSSTPYWQRLDDSMQTADYNYTGTITANIAEYLDASNRIHIMLFNEDDSDSLFIDYINVDVTTNAADLGTITSPGIDFDDGSGPVWGGLLWTDSEPSLSTITYQLEYLVSGTTWAVIPNSALSGNETGFTTSPIDLSGLNTTTYNEIRIVATLDCFVATCPSLNDWTVRWSPGFTVSGTAFEYDGVSSTTSGTVAVAVNGELQIGKTGTISNGSWTISNLTVFDGDIITVFVDGATDSDEAVAVTAYDGTPDIPGLRLQKRHLTIGSNDYETITNTHLGLYDYTSDEDLFFDVDVSNDLTMCADATCGDASIVVLSQNTYAPGTGADIITHDFRNDGTFTPGSNNVRVSGSWDNNATTTMTGSTLIFTATSSTETIDSTGALSASFNNVTFGETSGSATWSLGSALDVNGNMLVTYGTLNRDIAQISIAGNLTTGSSGLWSGIGTTTFDGTNPSTWTDQNATRQNIGRVLVDGTAKSLFLGSSTTMQSLLVGADDTFDVTSTGHHTSVYENWIIQGTFTARTGTVNFIATTTNRTITPGGDAFYNLTANGAGGAWSFSEADITITNDLVIATGTLTLSTGTTTIGGSFTNSGGTFAHNNAIVSFTSGSAETLTLSGTVFTNAFYNVRFGGSGSWTFSEANATTSNTFRIVQGTVTFPSETLSVGGNFENISGTFAHANGTTRFTGNGSHIIDTNASFYNVLFTGSSTASFVDTNVTAVEDVTIVGGTVTFPSGTFSIGGSLTNTGTVVSNTGTVLFNSTDTGETISLGESSLYNLTIQSSTGGWTISAHATTTNAFTLTSGTSFTLASGQTLAVLGVFTNSVGGASTTWTGGTLSLESGAYSVNTKTNTGDVYEILRVRSNTDIQMWNSSATTYEIDSTGSLYSQDHAGNDGDLYIFGNYVRTSGTEYWSSATDFDGTSISTSTRQVDVRIVGGGSVALTGSTLHIVGSSTATTTIANQGSGTYTLSVTGGTTTMSHYDFSDLGVSGLSLLGSTIVTSLADGRFVPSVNAGTGLTLSSTTIDANPGLQVYRVDFSTTTAIAASNVTQIDGAPASYWWFRNSTGTIDGESFDNDTADPGSVRWDDSSLTITVSGTVYESDAATTMGAPTCGAGTSVRIMVEGGGTHDGACNGGGVYSIPGVVIIGDPTLTIFLNGASGGERAVTVTKTPTADLTNVNLVENHVIVRHEDTSALTIDDMAAYDSTDDTDVPFVATSSTLTIEPNFALMVSANKTFTPGGTVVLQSSGSGAEYDGSLYLRPGSTFTGAGTTTYSIGGSFTQYTGATFVSASTTVVLTATTTGKGIVSSSTETISLNNLSFTGVGGGWNLNGNLSLTGDMSLGTGTLTGTGDVTLQNGSLYGDGTLSFGSGTTTLVAANTLGGSTAWVFANLALGTGSQVGTTTKATNATTTIGERLTIGAGHFFMPGGSIVNLTGSGSVFVENGTFLESTSTVRYGGTSGSNVLGTTYYNLLVNGSGGTPTYTGAGTGIIVSNTLSVGGTSNTTFTLDTNDPALDVNGNVLIASNGTLVGSNSGACTVGGSWDNDGTFTHSNGLVTFDGTGVHTIAGGTSSFSDLTINGTGDFTVSEHATATDAFVLTAANDFTLDSGLVLAVGGTFSNALGGVDTDWTGSTLFLYGGGNYQINASTTNDIYGTLAIGANTQIRMWNSSAAVTSLAPTASLYSQDHAEVTGDLYIYGAYTKNSGTDFWSYATDFDGTVLGGGRQANVYLASGSSVLYQGGGLSVIGSASASTTIQNQGSGTYSVRVGGSASTTFSYYDMSDFDANGLVFSGTPTIANIGRGSFTVNIASGTAITVGGTVINQNPAKTFTNNSFGTSTGGLAFNVTATGTTVSSWRFTNHSGVIAGEAYDVDPDGNPGYLVWDDSNAALTISGRVYSDEGSAVSGVCTGATNITLRVAGLTTYQTSCDGTGLYTIYGVTYSPGDSLVVYIDGETEKAATVSEDPVTNISTLDLYENRVIVRHEGSDPLSIADMSVWDSSDDADIPFTAVDGSPDTLTLPSDRKLIVWSGKEFEPNGNVTITGAGAGASYDGTLELYTNATFDATGSETHAIGGSLLMGTGATFDDETSTVTFTTTGAARTIDTNDQSFYNLVLNGSGSWTITNTTLDIGNDFTITQGSVTLPSATTTISGSFQNTGGAFTQTTGSMYFTSAGAETVRVGTGAFGTTTFTGGGSWTYQGGNGTTTGDFSILSGSLTAPTGTLTIGGDFSNNGTFTHSGGTIRMTSPLASTTINASSSDLGGVIIEGTGTFLFTDTSEALTGSLILRNGTTTLPTSVLSVGGSFISSGGAFIHATGTLLFNSSDVGEVITPGSGTFAHLTIAAPGGGYTITGSATTTGNFSLTSLAAFTLQSGATLSVSGVFTNLVGGAATTWDGTTIIILSGSNYTVNTKVAGDDIYNIINLGNNTDIRLWNSAATTTVSDTLSSLYSQNNAAVNGELYIYGNYARTTGADYWSAVTNFDGTAIAARAVTVRHASGATSTFSGDSLEMIGTAAATTTITNQGSGTYSLQVTGGTLNAQYYAIRNIDVYGLVLSGTTTITSLANGDFELAVSGGALMTVSSTTLNYNASAVISGVRFATTTAISGVNVALVGTTPSAWTFTSHRGNLDGEAFDSDGGDDCGSVRFDDSTCLLTQQSAYRWRNDDGGEGVPDSEWFDSNWTKRKRVTITNADATEYTNAVVEVPITFDSDMQVDFDDLRVTDITGTTTLDFVREIYTASTEATLWVEIPTLAASADTQIYVYYGNGGAAYGGVGTTTFVVYDDFEDGNVTEYSGESSLFTVDATHAYQGAYGLDASDPEERTTDGIYRTSASSTVSQGETIRFLQYVDSAGTLDEVCTLFGVQSGNQNNNYGVCLEQVSGTDRISISRGVDDNDLSGTVLATTSVAYSAGWYEVEVDWGLNDVIFVSLYKDNTLVATTSATDGTYTEGGIGFTYWFQNGGWDFYTARPTLESEPTTTVGYEQVSGGASWAADLNTAFTGVDVGTIVRPRFLIENTGLSVSDQYQLMYAEKGASPSCESVTSGSYSAVPIQASCGTSPICMEPSTHFTNNSDTTDILGGDGVFALGEIIEDPSNTTNSTTVGANEYTEVEYAVAMTENATDPSYCLRVSDNGTAIDSYTKVAEIGLIFEPNITSLSFNNGVDINLLPGATTTLYATGTVTDQNGYTDIILATTTLFRSGVGGTCTADTNNCYIAAPSQCSYVNCSGNSCDIVCSADFYYHADPTDIGTYAAETWRALLTVEDGDGLVATATAPSIDLVTLRALSVDNTIDYGTLEVNGNTGTYNATTSFSNEGNDSIDVSIEGTNLSDGVSSVIPVSEQIFATSSFSYSACVYCTQLSGTAANYELDLTKPATTTPGVTDEVYWGIEIPFGISAAPHYGTNVFYAVGD